VTSSCTATCLNWLMTGEAAAPASSSSSINSSSCSNAPAHYAPPWHRALDTAVTDSQGALRTYRPFLYYETHNVLPTHAINSSSSSRGPGSCAERAVSVRHGQVSTSPLAFIHPPNQPLKESSWGMSLVQSALRANCWPHNQPGKVKGLAHSPWLYMVQA
jgi:hypothetical protein